MYNSCIYQIMHSTDCERIGESTFYEHLDKIPADSVRDLDEADEDDRIKKLPNILPQSMFKCEGREITFLGGDKSFIETWKENVKQTVDDCSTGNIISGGSTWAYLYDLKNAVSNMLDVDCRFYFDNDGYTIESTEFILDCMKMEPGTKLYVGAVIDYRY